MAHRLIEIVCPATASLDGLLPAEQVVEMWQTELAGGRRLIRVLVDAGHASAVLDAIERRFQGTGEFRVVVLPVEAVLPKPREAEAVAKRGVAPGARLSREELRADVHALAELTWTYLAFIALSAVVAGVGLLRGSATVVIGGMVIAPLLGPNVALGLATTLGDVGLARQAIRTGVVGLVAAGVIGLGLGLGFQPDPSSPEIFARTELGLGDLALALASGAAATLAVTTGASASLIGVMVAVALMPPALAATMLLGAGHDELAGRAALLLGANIICVNLAAVLAFAAQGVRPLFWWEAGPARRSFTVALITWTLLLAALVAIVVALGGI